jgi:RNA polymerase sigma-70 factor, ECF subfamily
MKDEEQELLLRLREGDETAVDHFFSKMALRLVSFLMSKKWSHRLTLDEAQDVTQEALLVILSKLSTFEPSGAATFSTWCYRIADNIATWRYCEKLRQIYLSDVEEELLAANSLDEGAAEVQVFDPEDQDIEALVAGDGVVQCALRALRDEDRQVVLLKVLRGLTHNDIANKLGKSEAAVRVQFHRAIGKLRVLLERAVSKDHG